MMCRRLRMCRLVASVFTLAAVSGCVNWQQLKPAEPDVGTAREQRKQQIVQNFESRRDSAQLQAAIALWEQGDAKGSEELLLQLLERTPSHAEARMWLADLYAEQDNPTAAEQQLRTLLQENPLNAQAHHSLGLLLDATGRSSEAVQHLQQAQRLNPDEPLYAQSLQAIHIAGAK